MTLLHDQNHIGLVHQVCCELLRPMRIDIQAALGHGIDRAPAGGMIDHRVRPGRVHGDIRRQTAILDLFADESLGHGRAANVAGANDEHIFHDG